MVCGVLLLLPPPPRRERKKKKKKRRACVCVSGEGGTAEAAELLRPSVARLMRSSISRRSGAINLRKRHRARFDVPAPAADEETRRGHPILLYARTPCADGFIFLIYEGISHPPHGRRIYKRTVSFFSRCPRFSFFLFLYFFFFYFTTRYRSLFLFSPPLLSLSLGITACGKTAIVVAHGITIKMTDPRALRPAVYTRAGTVHPEGHGAYAKIPAQSPNVCII